MNTVGIHAILAVESYVRDWFDLGSGDDFAVAGDGADYVTGGAGIDMVHGGTGADWLAGDEDDDELHGDDGDDFLAGGAGNDWLVGGVGSDTFLFGLGDGEDGVADFEVHGGNPQGDTIVLSGQSTNTFTRLMATATEWAGTTYLNLDNGAVVTLYGVAIGQLSADDFLFA